MRQPYQIVCFPSSQNENASCMIKFLHLNPLEPPFPPLSSYSDPYPHTTNQYPNLPGIITGARRLHPKIK